MRWSITAIPSKPIESAANAISRSHRAGSPPQGNRETAESPAGGWRLPLTIAPVRLPSGIAAATARRWSALDPNLRQP